MYSKNETILDSKTKKKKKKKKHKKTKIKNSFQKIESGELFSKSRNRRKQPV